MGGYYKRKKSCRWRSKEITTGERQVIDYKEFDGNAKDFGGMKEYIDRHTFKMVPRRVTGVSALYQRRIALAVKRARFLALLPYCEHHK